MQAKGDYNVASLFGVTIVLINFQVSTNAFYIAISWKFLRTIPVIAVKHFTLLSYGIPVKILKTFSIYGHCILVIFLWWRTNLFTWSSLESLYIGNFLWWKTTISHGLHFESLYIGDLLQLLAGLLTTTLTLASMICKGEHFAPHRTAFSLQKGQSLTCCFLLFS